MGVDVLPNSRTMRIVRGGENSPLYTSTLLHLGIETMTNYENNARDNTYDNENDFSADFTWTVWLDENDSSDWVWNREAAYIAICRHLGGDPRGNYGGVSLYRLDDSIGDSGFLDWVLGWDIRRFHGFSNVPTDEMDETRANWIVSESEHDEAASERCCPGYASLPSSEIGGDDDECHWHNGSAIVKDGENWIVATPYHYTSCEIETPANGRGYLCDASINTDSFIEEVLGECVFDEIGQLESKKVDRWLDSVHWDCDEVIGKLCRVDGVISSFK